MNYDHCIESAGHSQEYHVFHRGKAIRNGGIEFGSGTTQSRAHNLTIARCWVLGAGCWVQSGGGNGVFRSLASKRGKKERGNEALESESPSDIVHISLW